MANESVYIGFLGPTKFVSSAAGIVFPGNVQAERFLGADGTAALPTFSFYGTGGGDNGMYLSAADTLGWAAGGTLRLSLSSSALLSTVGLIGPAGTAGVPTYAATGALTTGLAITATPTWILSVAGAAVLTGSATTVTSAQAMVVTAAGNSAGVGQGTYQTWGNGTNDLFKFLVQSDNYARVQLGKASVANCMIEGMGPNFFIRVNGTSLVLFDTAGISAHDDNVYDVGHLNAVSPNGRWRNFIAGTAFITAGTNGQQFKNVQQLNELTTIAAAATTDTTIQMPANSVVLGVSVRVTTVIPTAATFTVGDSGSAARFSTAAVSTAAGSTDSGVKAGAYYNASALSIRITPNLTPADNTGRVRVTIYYYTITPPTS